jgi:hypothetical protein
MLHSARYYLGFYSVGVVGGFIALFLTFHLCAMTDRRYDWRSYEEILLDYTLPPRIIVESGSNSRHAIIQELMERELKTPVIVVADIAAIPMAMKVSRLEKYAQKGDTIILPIEWYYYVNDSISTEFISGVTLAYSEYYFSLSLIKKILFFFSSINTDLIVSKAWHRLSSPRLLLLAESHNRMLGEEINLAPLTRDTPQNRTRNAGMKGQSCSTYTTTKSLFVGPIARQLIQSLADLKKDKGVDVVLTWPAVAGTDCYDQATLEGFVPQLRKLAEAAGIPILGTPQESLFTEDHILDTYYHIDFDAAVIRTSRLADNLKAAGLPKTHVEPFVAGAVLKAEAVDKEKDRLRRNQEIHLRPLQTGSYSTAQSSHFFVLSDGWYDAEGFGVWSQGSTSKIIVLPKRGVDCHLQLQGFAFESAPAPSIRVGGLAADLDENGFFTLPAGDTAVEILLHHSLVRSPKELGISGDPRDLAYALQAINVHCP